MDIAKFNLTYDKLLTGKNKSELRLTILRWFFIAVLQKRAPATDAKTEKTQIKLRFLRYQIRAVSTVEWRVQ